MESKEAFMKTFLTVGVGIAALAFLSMTALTPPVFAATGAVLSVTGDVQTKATPGADWQRLKRGVRIAGGSTVKTGPDAFARILSPDGTLIKIPAAQEQVLSFSSNVADGPEVASESSSPGYSAFVAEFFSPNQRTRINAVRSHLSPLQQDWIAFSRFNHLSPDKIETALELAAAFQAENSANRSVYILWKLKSFFPDDPGIQALADRAVGALESGGQWTINGDIIRGNRFRVGGKALQIAYNTFRERYVYVYHSVRTPEGTVVTTRLFPDTDDLMALAGRTFFASRVAAEERLSAKEDGVAVRVNATPFAEMIGVLDKDATVTVLEKQGRRYRIAAESGLTGWVLKHKLAGETAAEGKQSGDVLTILRAPSDTGVHYLWGWASPGPMPPWAVEGLLARVNGGLASEKGNLSRELISAALPDICQDVQVLYLAGR